MHQPNSSAFRTTSLKGCHTFEHLRPFNYGWKRLARTSGMQQHTEQRSVCSGSKLSVMNLAALERPPPATCFRHRASANRAKQSHRQHALLQESLLESAPSQTNTEGRLTTRWLVLCSEILGGSLVCHHVMPSNRDRIHVEVLSCSQLVAPPFSRLCSTQSILCWELACCPFHMH